MPKFTRCVGIDYFGAETPRASLKGPTTASRFLNYGFRPKAAIRLAVLDGGS